MLFRVFSYLCMSIIVFSASPVFSAHPWAIVHRNASSIAEELKLHLTKATSRPCTIWEEGAFDNSTPAFYVGQTDFAKNNGIDFSSFKPDGWAYKSFGENVVLTGHRHDGTQNAVYQFLENELGIRWYTFESSYIPVHEQASFSGLDRAGRPAFILRGIYMPPWDQKITRPADIYLFQKRIRLNGYTSVQAPATWRPNCHSFYDYVSPEKYFATHPEYFSMNDQGKRYHGANRVGGQLCLTNPEVAEIATNTLENFIRSDRANYPEEKWPVVYDVSQLDSTSYLCLCPKCRDLSEKEGSDAALVLTFINRIADKIRLTYPDIIIRTTAYVSSEKAPKTLRPADNVLIMICDLYTKSDCYRPLTHEFNAQRRSIFDSWKEKDARISVWDYWNMAHDRYFEPPRIETMVDAIPEDLRYLRSIGVENYFTEAETNMFSNPQNFYDLQLWLGAKLLENPDLDAELLIVDFMTHHYGPAAAPMQEFLHMVRTAVRNEASALIYVNNPSRTYQTPEFLQKCYELLKQAQSMTAPGSSYRLRVEKEMISPVLVMLLNSRTGIDKVVLAQEYEICRLGQIMAYAASDQVAMLKNNLAKDLQKYTLTLDIPERFNGIAAEKIMQFAYPVFDSVVEEPGSPLGKALMSKDKEVPGKFEHILKPQAGSLYPTSFGVYDSDRKQGLSLHITDIPQDEQYHWYDMGEFDFGKNTYVWGWYCYIKADLRSVWINADGLEGYNKWNVWISVRINGPAYVKGSQQKNAIMLDRIALIKK